MSDTRVLLVDDEAEFVAVLAERLESRGLAVTTAPDGATALTSAKTHRFDAVLLDMSMPGMDGVEALQQLRADNPDLQVILLTGRATPSQAADAIKLGAMDLLEKPADIEVIVARIEEAAVRTVELLEERADEKAKDILKKKGW